MKLCKDCKHYYKDESVTCGHCKVVKTTLKSYEDGTFKEFDGYCVEINTDGNCEKYEEKK